MPWTGQTFKKHNKGLSGTESDKAARVANAVLEKTNDEGKAIRIANAVVNGTVKHPSYASYRSHRSVNG